MPDSPNIAERIGDPFPESGEAFQEFRPPRLLEVPVFSARDA
jgi:hypothetical protein